MALVGGVICEAVFFLYMASNLFNVVVGSDGFTNSSGAADTGCFSGLLCMIVTKFGSAEIKFSGPIQPSPSFQNNTLSTIRGISASRLLLRIIFMTRPWAIYAVC